MEQCLGIDMKGEKLGEWLQIKRNGCEGPCCTKAINDQQERKGMGKQGV